MPADTPATPSEMALAELRARIAADETLEQQVKDALAHDLGSDNPSAFERLKEALKGKGPNDEAEKS